MKRHFKFYGCVLLYGRVWVSLTVSLLVAWWVCYFFTIYFLNPLQIGGGYDGLRVNNSHIVTKACDWEFDGNRLHAEGGFAHIYQCIFNLKNVKIEVIAINKGTRIHSVDILLMEIP